MSDNYLFGEFYFGEKQTVDHPPKEKWAVFRRPEFTTGYEPVPVISKINTEAEAKSIIDNFDRMENNVICITTSPEGAQDGVI